MPYGPTPSQTIGPFYGFALPFPGGPAAVDPATPGAVLIEGQVVDGAGAPVPDAMLEVWQGDRFARCFTDAEGVYHLTAVKPEPVPAPGGGLQAPHLNVTIFARGLLRHLSSRLYFPDEQAANRTDPVLNLVGDEHARSSLVAREERGCLRFDIRLQGDDETVFFAV